MIKSKYKKIAIFTTSRADFGLLRGFIKKINNVKNFKNYLIVSGSHLEKKSGYTINEIFESKLKIHSKININLKKGDPRSISKSIATGMIKFTSVLQKIKPHLIVVLGDRFELIPICYSATLLNIPIVHFNGGESSEGSIDEVTRNCVSKMSHIHFASTNHYRKKLILMGENPKKVFNIGSLSVENVKNSCNINKNKIFKILKISKNSKFFLITYHPSTLEINNSIIELKNLLMALERFKKYFFIFTGTNDDPKNEIFKNIIENFVKKNKRARFFKSLGSNIYLSSMKYCSCIIGNSSSGILETPSLKKPVVNIGNRQKGRVRGKNVIDVDERVDKICNAIKLSQSIKFQKNIKFIKSPFGKGNTSKRAIEILKKENLKNILMKKFYMVSETL